VQVIPHVTDEIKAAFRKVADGVDVVNRRNRRHELATSNRFRFSKRSARLRLELGAENTVFRARDARCRLFPPPAS